MTPIFKRLLRRSAIAAAFMLLIMLMNILSRSSELSESIRVLTNVVNANSISAESFDTAEKADKTTELLGNELGQKYFIDYSDASNKFDVVVPAPLYIVESAKNRSVDFSFGMGFALAASCAAFAFADERGRKKQSFINALPYKRTRLFWERTLSGILPVCLFFLINYIVLALFIRHYIPSLRFLGEKLAMGDSYMQSIEHIKYIGKEIFLNALAAILFYSVILFAQTIFGSTASACIMTCGALFFAMAAANGISDICDIYNNAFTENLRNILIKISDLLHSDRLILAPIFITASAVFIVMAFISDKNIRIERIGELFMFKPLKYLVTALFAAEGAFTFFHFIYWLCDIRVKAFLPVIGILAVGAALTLLLFNKLFLKGEH